MFDVARFRQLSKRVQRFRKPIEYRNVLLALQELEPDLGEAELRQWIRRTTNIVLEPSHGFTSH